MQSCPKCESLYPWDYKMCPKDGTVLITSQELRPGMILREGKYCIIERLGAGAMGSVYKVRNLYYRLGEDIGAMKIPTLDLSQNSAYVKQFLDEAAKARVLKNENIVRIDDVDRMEGGLPFLVMEFIPGRSLRDWLMVQPQSSWRRVAEVGASVAAALATAHDCGIVHCDIKPENILSTTLLNPTPLKVTDFGIAKAISDLDGNITNSIDRISGTPPYMSPEQTLSRKAVSPKSDVYSLGVVLYEMAIGQKPFSQFETPEEIMRAHRESPPPRMSGTDVPQPLRELVEEMLAKEPVNRPTASEVCSTLKKLLDGYTPTAQLNVPRKPEQPGFSRSAGSKKQAAKARPLWRSLVWALVVVLVLGSIAAFVAAGRNARSAPRPIKPIIVQPIPVPPNEIIDESFERGAEKERGGDYSAAEPLYEEACDRGVKEACASLASLFHKHPDRVKDDARSFASFTRGCNGGDPASCTQLGFYYDQGIAVKQDRFRAAELSEQGCKGGDPHGCTNLGVEYDNGGGLALDLSRAFTLYENACDKGDAAGCGNLGRLYNNGSGVKSDHAHAAILFKQACDAGDTDSCASLGMHVR